MSFPTGNANAEKIKIFFKEVYKMPTKRRRPEFYKCRESPLN